MLTMPWTDLAWATAVIILLLVGAVCLGVAVWLLVTEFRAGKE